MTAVDWSALTAEEIVEAARTMPRVAGPWVVRAGRMIGHVTRVTTGPYSIVAADVYRTNGGPWQIRVLGFHGRHFGDAESAKAAADARLREMGVRLMGDARREY